MTLPEALDSANTRGPSVVTLGTFDGVHRGHQHLIGQLAREARSRRETAVALTFFPRPAEVLRPETAPPYLCSIEQRCAWLREAGADHVIVIPFDLALSRMGAEEFCSHLVAGVGMRWLVGGPDLALGQGRAGTPDVLREIGGRLGFDLAIVPAFEIAGEVVHTRVIRKALEEADLERAERLLGRRFSVDGEIVHGEGRGRTIGIPTANVATSPKLVLPANGVYAVEVEIAGQRYAGAANLGTRPTFSGQTRSLEIHLLDFSGDIYGLACRVDFVARLRAEQRFLSIAELVEQIQRDVASARALLRPG
jgi:riboflavin kinase / FMN adenylyltransferase